MLVSNVLATNIAFETSSVINVLKAYFGEKPGLCSKLIQLLKSIYPKYQVQIFMPMGILSKNNRYSQIIIE